MTDSEFEALWSHLVQKSQQGYLDGNPTEWSKLSSESHVVKQLHWQVTALKSMVKGLIMALTDKGYLIPVSLEEPYMVPNPQPVAAKELKFQTGPVDWPLSMPNDFNDFNEQLHGSVQEWMKTMEDLYKKLDQVKPKTDKPHSVKIVKKPKALIAVDTETNEKPP